MVKCLAMWLLVCLSANVTTQSCTHHLEPGPVILRRLPGQSIEFHARISFLARGFAVSVWLFGTTAGNYVARTGIRRGWTALWPTTSELNPNWKCTFVATTVESMRWLKSVTRISVILDHENKSKNAIIMCSRWLCRFNSNGWLCLFFLKNIPLWNN